MAGCGRSCLDVQQGHPLVLVAALPAMYHLWEKQHLLRRTGLLSIIAAEPEVASPWGLPRQTAAPAQPLGALPQGHSYTGEAGDGEAGPPWGNGRVWLSPDPGPALPDTTGPERKPFL